MKELERLESQLDVIAGIAGDGPVGARAPDVSGWSVAQQLDHVLLVMERSLGLLHEEPEALRQGINWKGRLLLGIGRIPRGRARAPRGLEGSERGSDELAATVGRVRELSARLGRRPDILSREEPVLKHPQFGGLSARQALRMLAVHTDHHLRIIRDIRRRQ